jgi:hypothetical protein
MSEKVSVIMVSYVPLLVGEAGRSDLDPKQVSSVLEECPSGQAQACIWLADEPGGPLFPCLLIDQAEAIAEHLKMWSEGEPGEWFELTVAERGELYGLALMPRLSKGIERFRLAYQLRCGLPLPKDAHIQAIFKPLHFVSKPGHTYGKVRSQIGPRAKVALLDPRHLAEDVSKTDFDKAISLGEFELVREGPMCGFVSDQLKAGA